VPVPVDALVYTPADWDAVLARRDRFARMLEREEVWVVDIPNAGPSFQVRAPTSRAIAFSDSPFRPRAPRETCKPSRSMTA
jgi:hypothetical protein